jgi:hypothetical protein
MHEPVVRLSVNLNPNLEMLERVLDEIRPWWMDWRFWIPVIIAFAALIWGIISTVLKMEH